STPVLFFLPCPPIPALPSYPTRRSSDLHHHAGDRRLRRHHSEQIQCGGGLINERISTEIRHQPQPEARTYLHGRRRRAPGRNPKSEEHTSELQSRFDLVCRLLLEKKKTN